MDLSEVPHNDLLVEIFSWIWYMRPFLVQVCRRFQLLFDSRIDEIRKRFGAKLINYLKKIYHHDKNLLEINEEQCIKYLIFRCEQIQITDDFIAAGRNEIYEKLNYSSYESFLGNTLICEFPNNDYIYSYFTPEAIAAIFNCCSYLKFYKTKNDILDNVLINAIDLDNNDFIEEFLKFPGMIYKIFEKILEKGFYFDINIENNENVDKFLNLILEKLYMKNYVFNINKSMDDRYIVYFSRIDGDVIEKDKYVGMILSEKMSKSSIVKSIINNPIYKKMLRPRQI